MFLGDRLPAQSLFTKGKLFRHPAFWFPVLLGGLIALFAGNDILSRHSYLTVFVYLMGAIVPSIQEWGLYSEFRQPIMLYFSVLWLFVPLQSWLALNSREMMDIVIEDWKRKKGKRYYGPVLLALFMLPCTYFILTVAIDLGDGCTRYCITRSRLALAAIGFLLPIATAICWATILCPLRYFQRLYMR